MLWRGGPLKLRTLTFVWVSLAAMIPLLALFVGATAYSQMRYEQEVDNEIAHSLNNIISGMETRLGYEREVILSLAKAPEVEAFLDVMNPTGEVHNSALYELHRARLNQFLAALQTTVPGMGSIRILNARGNTVIKTRFGRPGAAVFESIDNISYVEEELQDPAFLAELKAMVPGELVYRMIPQSRWDLRPDQILTMLNAVLPLTADDGSVVGYLVVNTFGEYIDRILKLAPRLHEGELMIAELNPDDRERDGMLLYEDKQGITFSEPKSSLRRLQEIENGELWQYLQTGVGDIFQSHSSGLRYYVYEYHPYPNQLVSWVLISVISQQNLYAPFATIRQGIILFAIAALVLTLTLAGIGTRWLSGPMMRLARNLKTYGETGRVARFTEDSTEEMLQLSQAFTSMVDSLESAREARMKAEKQALQSAKLASIGEMAAGIGHEINNPLNNILSLTKLIERSLPASQSGLLEDVRSLRDEANRASRIVRGVLNFARQVPAHFTEFEVGPWLVAVVESMKKVARKEHVILSLDRSPDCRLEGDADQLRQVMVNLISNAIQASTSGQIVSVTAYCHEKQLVIEVSDQGIGIDEDLLDKVFDPFFTTKPVNEGTGLGLSISLGIIQEHKADLQLRNNSQGGVTAIVTLPRKQGRT